MASQNVCDKSAINDCILAHKDAIIAIIWAESGESINGKSRR